MEIFFDHIVAKQSDYTFNHTIVSATFDPQEYDTAFETGWVPDTFWYSPTSHHTQRCKKSNEFVWTPCRSSRINIEKFSTNKNQRRLFKNNVTPEVVTDVNKVNPFLLYHIYRDYVDKKGFKDYYTNVSDFQENYLRNDFHYILYWLNTYLTAFCVVQPIGSNLMSYQFCWDYKDPKLSLGIYSQIYEVEYAKSLGLKNVYIGAIAEQSNFYKSKFQGFEYFDNKKWKSKDDQLEIYLSNDTNADCIADLVNMQNTYLSK